ncbi:protein D2-like [Phlebotomus argentipes]|uniref:protein D2-like n=1 Tax=Phlebotomus argentipes TaxID=94469 RepID=UPI002892DC47|nr:protein D2-like [Phlebotomus argentipes]
MFLKIIITVLIIAISEISVQCSVASKFRSHDVVPDVIPNAPENPLEVKYPSGVFVDFGNELAPVDVKDVPTVTWNANPEHLYTLISVDPDVPNRENPEFSEIKSWMVVNIPGNNVANGETIVEYIGSGPYKDSGLHRYVFIVLKQPSGKIDFSGEKKATKSEQDGRRNFSILKFAEKYSLDVFAGNFFLAQFDDYVPILIAQLHPELALNP